MIVTKDTQVGEIIDFDETAKPFFEEIGMECFDCPFSRMETLEMACAGHGTDVNLLVEKLNAHFASRK